MDSAHVSKNCYTILSVCVSVVLITFLPLISSCIDYCREYLPQQFKFGSYPIELNAPTKIRVGDKVLVSVSLPRSFYDSISNVYVEIDRNITIVVKLDRYTRLGTDTADFFAVPRTIFQDFDNYFDLKVLKGKSTNVYQHDCVFENGKWVLELEYTTKRPGVFYFDTNFMDINTSRADLPKGTCSVGDPQFDARISFDPANDQIEDEFYFGFVVE